MGEWWKFSKTVLVEKRTKRASVECEGKKNKVVSFHFAVSKPIYFHWLKGVRSPTEPTCKVVFENEQDNTSVTKRKRSLVTAEPQHVTLIVFGIGMVNRTHLEADIGGLTMESELKRIHGSFTLKEKMKGMMTSWYWSATFLKKANAMSHKFLRGDFSSENGTSHLHGSRVLVYIVFFLFLMF